MLAASRNHGVESFVLSFLFQAARSFTATLAIVLAIAAIGLHVASPAAAQDPAGCPCDCNPCPTDPDDCPGIGDECPTEVQLSCPQGCHYNEAVNFCTCLGGGGWGEIQPSADGITNCAQSPETCFGGMSEGGSNTIYSCSTMRQCFEMTKDECLELEMSWVPVENYADPIEAEEAILDGLDGKCCVGTRQRVIECGYNADDRESCMARTDGRWRWRVEGGGLDFLPGTCCQVLTREEADERMQTINGGAGHQAFELMGDACEYKCESLRSGKKSPASPIDCALSLGMSCGEGEQVNLARGEFQINVVDSTTPGRSPALGPTIARTYRSKPDRRLGPSYFYRPEEFNPGIPPREFRAYLGSDALGEGWYFPLEMRLRSSNGCGARFTLLDGYGQIRDYTQRIIPCALLPPRGQAYSPCGGPQPPCFERRWAHPGTEDEIELVDPETCEFQIRLKQGGFLKFEALTCELDAASDEVFTDEGLDDPDLGGIYPMSAYEGRLKEIIDAFGNSMVVEYRDPEERPVPPLPPLPPDGVCGTGPDHPCEGCNPLCDTEAEMVEAECAHWMCGSGNPPFSCTSEDLPDTVAEACDIWQSSPCRWSRLEDGEPFTLDRDCLSPADGGLCGPDEWATFGQEDYENYLDCMGWVIGQNLQDDLVPVETYGDSPEYYIDRVVDGTTGEELLSFEWSMFENWHGSCQAINSPCWFERITKICRADGTCFTYDYYTLPESDTWWRQELGAIIDPDGAPGMLKSVTTPPLLGLGPGDDNEYLDGLTTTYTYWNESAEQVLEDPYVGTVSWWTASWSAHLTSITNAHGQVVLKNGYYGFDVPLDESEYADGGNFNCGPDFEPLRAGRIASQVLGDETTDAPRRKLYEYHPTALTTDSVPDEWKNGTHQHVTPRVYDAVMHVVLNDEGRVRHYGINSFGHEVELREYMGFAEPGVLTTMTENRPGSAQGSAPRRPEDPEYYETTTIHVAGDHEPVSQVFPNGNRILTSHYRPIPPGATAEARTCAAVSRGNTRKVIHDPGPIGPEHPWKVEADQPWMMTILEYDGDDAYWDPFGKECVLPGTDETDEDRRGYDVVTDRTFHEGIGDVPGWLEITYPDSDQLIAWREETFEYDRNLLAQQTTLGYCDPLTGVCHDVPSSLLLQQGWSVDSAGRISEVTMPISVLEGGELHRRVDQNAYDADGWLRQTTVDLGNENLTTVFARDELGRAIEETDPEGHTTRRFYNALGWLLREISPPVTTHSGQVVQYVTDYFYDATGNLVRTETDNRDENGDLRANARLESRTEYDSFGRAVRAHAEVADGQWVVAETDYDPHGLVVEERTGEAVAGRDPAARTTFEYDARGMLFQRVDAPGHAAQLVTRQDYDGNGNLVRVTRGTGSSARVTQHFYDGFDRLRVTELPDGTREIHEYHRSGTRSRTQVTGKINRAGDLGVLNELKNDVDDLGRIRRTHVAFRDAEGQFLAPAWITKTTDYVIGSNDVRQELDHHGNTTRFFKDTARRDALIIDTFGTERRLQYDKNGNPVQVTTLESGDPVPYVSLSLHDELNRLVQTMDLNTGYVNGFRHDSLGRITTEIDANGRVVQHEHDGLGRLVHTVRYGTLDQDSVSELDTWLEWDDNGRLTAQVDDNGNRTEYVFDPLGRATHAHFADGTRRETHRDPFGNVILQVEPDGQLVGMSYDAMDRMLARSASGEGGGSEQYEYDGRGDLLWAADDDSEVEREYDSFSNMTRETVRVQDPRTGAWQSPFVVTREHDANGVATLTTYPSGREVTIVPDTGDVGPVKRIGSVWLDGTSLIAAYEYLGDSRVHRMSFGNGTFATLDYDGARRIQRIRHWLGGVRIDDRSFTWDGAGNKLSHLDHLHGPSRTFLYDSFDRLVTSTTTDFATGTQEVLTYLLDGVNNRQRVFIDGVPTHYYMDPCDTVDPVTGQCVVDATDPADFPVNQYTVTPEGSHLHDDRGNLVHTSAPGDDVALTYDFRDRLVRHEKGSARHDYAYDALGRRLAKALTIGDSQIVNTTYYHYDGAKVVEERQLLGVTEQHRLYVRGDFVDSLLYGEGAAGSYWYISDEQHSVRALADAQGQLVERYDYADYGEPTFIAASGGVIPVSAVGNAWLYTGRPWDAESGFYNFRNRYLNPLSGRFLSRDPLGIWADEANVGNGSAYVGCNPHSRVDPTGTMMWGQSRLSIGPELPAEAQDTIEFVQGAFEGFVEQTKETDRWARDLQSMNPFRKARAVKEFAMEAAESIVTTVEFLKDPKENAQKQWDQFQQLSPREKGKVVGKSLAPDKMAVVDAAVTIVTKTPASKAARAMPDIDIPEVPTTRSNRRGTGANGVDAPDDGPGSSTPCKGNCFAEGTLVATSSGMQPIQDVQLGDAVTVLGESPENADAVSLDMLPAGSAWTDCVAVELEASLPDGRLAFMELLRPGSWADSNDARPGRWLHVESEAVDDALARVRSVSDCACPNQAGAGHASVTGRFVTTESPVMALDVVGLHEPLEVTPGHPFWSVDREAWIHAGDLEIGEGLQSSQGRVEVTGAWPLERPITVYNLEVGYSHEYAVSELGIRVHNTSGESGDTPGGKFGKHRSIIESHEATKTLDGLDKGTRQNVDKAIDKLVREEAGMNQHELKGDRAGQWAIDIPGSGRGRGGGRVIYVPDEDSVEIVEIVWGHEY